MNKFLLFVFAFAFLPLFSNAQSWERMADLPDESAFHHPVTWGIGEYGYSATGTNRNRQPTKDFFRYEAASDTWERMPEFPGSERGFAIGTAYGGKGYVGFGASETEYLGDIWEYDPVTETWDSLTTCPCQPRIHPAFVIAEGRVFVGLGGSANGNLRDFWEYNINTDTWRRHLDLPGPSRHHPFQFVTDGNVYAGMGHGDGVIYNDWYKFDIDRNRWEKMQAFPGEARVAGTQFDHGGYGYVLSGDGDDHNYMDTGEFWRYDALTDTWLQLPPHPGTSRWAPGSFVVGDRVYFLAGQNRSQGRLTFDMWTFPLELRPTNTRDQKTAETRLEIFPNPASEEINITVDQNIEILELYNLQGMLMRSWESPGNNIFVGDIVPGTFLIKAELSNGAVMTGTLVKQ